MVLREVLVLAISAGPFVVPDVEHRACLWGRFGFDLARVDLGSGWASLSPDYPFGFILRVGVGVCCCCWRGDCGF